MPKLSFSDSLAIAGIAIAILLVVLDKAGKLKGPILLILLAVAALMTVPLLLGLSWVNAPMTGMGKFSRSALMFFAVGLVYSLVAIWISPDETISSPLVQPLNPPAQGPTERFRVLGVAPVDVYKLTPLTIEGQRIEFKEQGISLLARVVNGSEPSIIAGIELKGKVHLNGTELSNLRFASPSLRAMPWSPMDEIKYWSEKKPYRQISWIGWLAGKEPIQLRVNEERVICFTLAEPGKLQGVFLTEGHGQLTEFVGYDDGSQRPKWVDKNPVPAVFFGDFWPVAGTFPTKIKEDFTNGNVKIALRLNSSSFPINPSAFQPLRRATEDELEHAALDEIYYGQNHFFRFNDLTPYSGDTRKK